MQFPKDIVRHEIVGLSIKIVESKNPSLLGLKGKIIDETKNTITIQTKTSTKKIIKDQIKMEIGNKLIEGKHLVGRPHERTSKK